MQELLGGKFGEMSTFMNYTFQSFNFRSRQGARPFYDLVASIAAEEFGHIELVAQQMTTPDEMGPYERLLWDASRGETELFARQDSVEEAWRVLDPVLGDVVPVKEYEPGTWGPSDAERLAPPGGWFDPQAMPPDPCPPLPG